MADHYTFHGYILDKEQYDKVNRLKWTIDENGDYPRGGRANLKNYLHNPNGLKNIEVKFKNKNKKDLREINVEVVHFKDTEMRKKYNIVSYIQGHFKTIGHKAYNILNPIWINTGGNYLMLCGDDTLCILDEKAYNIILEYEERESVKMTWSTSLNGYIIGNPTKIYIHQIVSSLYGQGLGKDKLTVDHIDRNPLNNRYDNLRHATYDEQKENNKRDIDGILRKERFDKKHFPPEIDRNDIPKYVSYRVETYGDNKEKTRDSFYIKHHPKMKGKVWNSSKSNKVSIREKLEQAKAKIYRIDNDIESEEDIIKYPVGVRNICDEKRGQQLTLDRRIKNIDGTKKILNFRMKINKELTEEENLEIFKKKIIEKYPDYTLEYS